MLDEAIIANKRRSVAIIAAFVGVVFLLAWFITYLFKFGPFGIVFAAVFAAGSAFTSYYNSDRIALAASRARPADEQEYRRYHNLVEGLCIAAGLPKPRLYVIDDPAPNAFATGRDPKHAAIAVTSGLLEKMNRVELEGVLAHELSHVRNYDILVMTLAVTMVGMVALLSDIFLRTALWGGISGRGRSDDNDGGAGALLGIIGIVLIALSPVVAYLMQRAISRQREYLADASGAMLTRYPPGLISALEKLQADDTAVDTSSKATAHLWIETPIERDAVKQRKYDQLFDTHPPIEERIARLRAL